MGPARIVALTEADWEVLADLRLRALADAFGTGDDQYRREEQYSARDWRRRISGHAQFAAWVANKPVGLVGAYRESPDTVYLYSLWLDPGVRGRGLAHDLIAAALNWARSQRARTVYLRVAADNAAARAVYTSLGFSPVHDTGAMVGELAMAITVG
jgi:RimJ/RimL family protein N-acetyltransferase